MSEFKIEDTDLYEELGVDSKCTTADIKKAYRKKALACHPDKNPDNPEAANLFHRLSKILEILTDEAARKAYDRVLNARKAAALRHRELDDKRKKLKEDLELRERQATYKKKSDDQILKEEIERLRKEGSKHLQEEMEYVAQLIREGLQQNDNDNDNDGSKYRIKIKWKVEKSDVSNGGYTQVMLEKFLSKYGDINILVVSPKKKGSALVEFKTKRAAEMAIEMEQGLSINPLTLQWVDEKNNKKQKVTSGLVKDSDFESVILTRLRQAEERKRLIEQMQKEDENS